MFSKIRSDAVIEALCRPLSGAAALRPFHLLGRMLRLQPQVVAIAVATHVAVAFTGALAIAMLLPLLTFLGSEGGQPTARIMAYFERGFAAVGIPLSLGPVLVVIFLVALAEIGLRAFHNIYLAVLSETLRADVRKLVFRRVMQASWQHLVGGRKGELIGVIVQEASNAAKAYLQTLKLLGVMLVVTVYFALAAWVSWRFTVLAGIAAALSLLLFRPLFRRSRSLGALSVVNNAALVEALEEHVSAIKVIRAMNAEKMSLTRVGGLIDQSAAYFRRLLSFPIYMKLAFEPVALAALLAAIWVAMNLLGLKLPEIIVLVALYTRIAPQLTEFQQSLQFVSSSLPAYEHVAKTLASLEAAREFAGGNRTIETLQQGIELRGVTVSIEGRRVLYGADLFVGAGQVVALVGESGAGKTSLIDVMTGMRRPDAGTVLVDGVPLAELSLASFRDRISLVPQEQLFFHDTIRNNLRLFAPSADDADLWQALDRVAAAEFVRERASGLDAVLGDNAVRVSGGQRQRLALARALLRRPQLLILDEPTSALDPDTEASVLDSLLRLRGALTILIVSHSQSFLASADRIYRLEDGKTEMVSAPQKTLTHASGDHR